MKKTQLLDLIRSVENGETSGDDDQGMELRFVEGKSEEGFF